MQKVQGLVCIGIAVIVTGCAMTTTKMSGTWQAPDFIGKNFNNILVLGVAKEETNRRMYEDKMVESLAMVGARAVASYRVLPKLDEGSEASVKELVAKKHYDGVLVTSLVKVKSEMQHVKGESYLVPDGYYPQGYYGYYTTSYTVVNEPGYNILQHTAVLETNFYDVESEQLVWSGRSETLRPQSAGKAIPSITSTISRELKKDGILK